MRTPVALALCSVTIAIAGAVYVPTASALPPEFWTCQVLVGGAYNEAACATKGLPKNFERIPLAAGAKIPFVIKSGAGIFKKAAEAIKCTADAGAGETNGPKEVAKVVIKFTKCTAIGGLVNCTTPGAAVGEIVTNQLEGPLVHLDKAGMKVGIKLTVKNQPVTEFNCGIFKIVIKGTTIGQITPINRRVLNFVINWKVAGGEQEWKQVEEEGPIFRLESESEEVTLESQEEVTPSEEIGIG